MSAIETGDYWVKAPCPRCGVIEEVFVVLSTVLTSPQDDVSTLRVKLTGTKVDHDCGQPPLIEEG